MEYWRRDPCGELPVVFLHVPGGVKVEDVERGRRATVALIRALVENKISKGIGRPDATDDAIAELYTAS